MSKKQNNDANKSRKIGANVKRLAALKVSRDVVPSGGGLADVMDFIKDHQRFVDANKAAFEWVFTSIDAIKALPDNPYGDDDEIIAGEILNKLGRQ